MAVMLYHIGMKKIGMVTKSLGATVTLVTAKLLFGSVTAFAANTCGETHTFFNWGGCDSGNPILSVLATILNWAAGAVVVVVLVGILYGAIMYASAGGKEDQVKKAIGIIRNAIIALILYFAMYAILQYLIPGGLFN